MPSKVRYAWRRYWCPRGKTIALDPDGYLLDPASGEGRYANPDLKHAEDLVDIPALVLLGEPGIGKSDSIKSEFEQLALGAGDGSVVLGNLREYSSDALLYQRLFQSRQIQGWRAGSGQLELMLDSLDEALLRIESVAQLLEAELRHLPIERLRLRIACRTAAWPHELLEPALRELWGEKNLGIYELAPLRACDVETAVRARGLDPRGFMDAVHATEAGAFANKPLTLNMLLNLFEKEQVLGKGAVDIFERGIRNLCEEQSSSRRTRSPSDQFAAGERMSIAGRIAMVTMLSNRFAIWTNPDRGDVPQEDVTLEELQGGSEKGVGRIIAVTREAISEVLDTGLFSSRGPGRMGWAHQGYAEFLAAWHLAHSDIPAATMARLVRHETGGLIPQLQQVAAWLATMRPDVRREITSLDPKAMLLSDLGAMDERDREMVIQEFLQALDERREFDLDIGLRQRYAKLCHGNLSTQLRPFMTDQSKDFVVRRAAIDIAEACQERGLETDLLTICLDTSENPQIRVQAVHALADCGSEASILKLKPLAQGDCGPDPDDELKGGALALLWPRYLTAREVFAALTPPKRSNLLGSYFLFLSRSLPEAIQDADLPVALSWVGERARDAQEGYDRRFEGLQDRILLLAWRHIDAPGVVEPLANAVLARLTHRHQLFESLGGEERQQFETEILSQPTQRRQLLGALLPLLQNERDAISVLIGRLMSDDDVDWLTSVLLGAKSGDL